MNLATIRDDLKARLATITGLTTYDTVPAKPEVPCAIVQPRSGLVHATFERGSGDIQVAIVVLVQCADWPSAQDALDASVGVGTTGSVVDALELTAGAAVLTVDTWDEYGTVTIGEAMYGTVTLHVTVLTSS
jgi:hypothetical protein